MIQRYFLGWQKDQNRRAAEELLRLFSHTVAGVNDLSSVLVLLPGRSAIRRVSRELGNVFPPVFRTAGTLLGGQEERTDPEQKVLWRKALCDIQQERFSTLFPLGFDKGNPVLIRNLAEQFHQLRTVLVNNLLSLHDAAEILGESDPRWLELAELERVLLKTMQESGLADPLEELKKIITVPAPFRDIRHVVLIGMPELPLPVRNLLEQIRIQNGISIHVFIFAPETHRVRFDDWGCVLPEAWSGYPLDFRNANLHVVHDPAEMAACARKLLTGQGIFEPDRYRISVTDRRFAPWLIRGFSDLCPCYDPAGISAGKLRVAPFLHCLADLATENSATSIRAFFDHPDSLRFLAGQNGQDKLLAAADAFFTARLPETIRADSPNTDPVLSEAFEKIFSWREMLLKSVGMTETVRVILDSVWQSDPPPKTGVLFADEAEAVKKALFHFERSPLLRALPCNEYLPALSNHLERMELYPVHAADAVELPGFLDLPFLAAEQVIVCGMNEGIIPESLPPDPYLSDKKRKLLHLPDNAARYARDCFYLDRLLVLYPGLHLISCKTDENGAPLRFPTLYFTGAEPEELRARVKHLFAPESPAEPPPETGFRFRLTPDFSGAFLGEDGITRLSVTDFKELLASPVRAFFTRHLKMEELAVNEVEMNPAVLGTLCHEALEHFDESAERDPEVLTGHFYHQAAIRFGLPLPLPVRIQCEMFSQRLRKCAAELTGTVLAKEWRLNGGKGILFHGALIKGTIDRIEYDNGELRLIDFKTKDTPEPPEKAHLRNKKLINLQLPLYVLLLRRDPLFRETFPHIDPDTVRITCGYFCIAKAVADIGYAMWDSMDQQILDDAEDTVDQVLEIIRLLRQGCSAENPDRKNAANDPCGTILKPVMREALDGITWLEVEEEGEEAPGNDSNE